MSATTHRASSRFSRPYTLAPAESGRTVRCVACSFASVDVVLGRPVRLDRQARAPRWMTARQLEGTVALDANRTRHGLEVNGFEQTNALFGII